MSSSMERNAAFGPVVGDELTVFGAGAIAPPTATAAPGAAAAADPLAAESAAADASIKESCFDSCQAANGTVQWDGCSFTWICLNKTSSTSKSKSWSS